MTYEGPRARATNRVMITLVIITIVFVAYWAIGGGLDAIPAPEPDSVTLAE